MKLMPSMKGPDDVVCLMLNHQDPAVAVTRNHKRDLRRRNLSDVPGPQCPKPGVGRTKSANTSEQLVLIPSKLVGTGGTSLWGSGTLQLIMVCSTISLNQLCLPSTENRMPCRSADLNRMILTDHNRGRDVVSRLIVGESKAILTADCEGSESMQPASQSPSRAGPPDLQFMSQNGERIQLRTQFLSDLTALISTAASIIK